MGILISKSYADEWSVDNGIRRRRMLVLGRGPILQIAGEAIWKGLRKLYQQDRHLVVVFQIPRKHEFDLFHMIGFDELHRILPLTVSGKDLALGNIYLKVGEEIAAASIEGETLIKRSGTRVIYDVSKDPDADKIDMSKMIAKIPEIRMSAQNGMLKSNDPP